MIDGDIGLKWTVILYAPQGHGVNGSLQANATTAQQSTNTARSLSAAIPQTISTHINS